MAKKGYLINDPVVQSMNDLQWLFEFESYAQERTEKYEDIKTIMLSLKKMIINLLGLNIMPLEEEDGGRLRLPTDDEIMPFSLIAGNEGFVTTVGDRWKDYKAQQENDKAEIEQSVAVYDTIEEYEATLPDREVVFPDDPEEFRKFMLWNSPETKRVMETWVKPLEKEPENEVKSNVSRLPKRRSVKVD